MVWALCHTRGCKHHVRTGLKRPNWDLGVDGQRKADGEYCWRCRAEQARREKKHAKMAARRS